MLDTLIQLDIDLFLWLNSFHSAFCDQVMWAISAKYTWVPLYALVLFFVFRKQKWWGLLTLLFMILLITAADQISVKVFKFGFERLRPCHNPALEGLVHIVNNKCGGQFGFVSSHAANSFAFAGFTAMFFNRRWYSYSILFWAAVVSYSRIYLGVHYPADIIGGALLGLLIAAVLYVIYKKTALKKIESTTKQPQNEIKD